MDSTPPRARIDQFFSVRKKRKIGSPALKSSGRQEKEARKQNEGSPTAKGSLESYLEASKDGNSHAKSLNATCDQKTRQVPVKRNLTLESGLPSKDEKGKQQSSEASGVHHISQHEPLCDIQKDSSIAGSVEPDSDLKDFATGFLSLYCSELKSSATLPSETKEVMNKTYSTSSVLQLEGKAPKGRCCSDDGYQSNIPSASISSPKVIHSKMVDESLYIDSNCLQKVTMGNNHTETLAGLRKCSYASNLCAAESKTPGAFSIKLGARETPQSTRGSSSFSPGDTFWNEAILVADGLLGENGGFASRIENHKAMKVDYDSNCSNNVNKEGKSNLFSSSLDGVNNTVCGVDKNLEKEVSPLPVKHFDFSLETKFSDMGTSAYVNNINPVILSRTDNTQNFSCMERCPKDQIAEVPLIAQETIHGHANILRNEDHLNQSSHHLTTNTPDRAYGQIAANHKSKSNDTPASSSVKDCLQLTTWLPLEICKIYNKKGISKLYPWQVECLQVEGVLHTRNLVYCASTSAGKSFVAEILMLRRILATGKIALLVLPYVSICAEKAEHLEVLLEPVGKHVRSFYGNQGGGTLPKDTSVAVCTIEKANSLINRLLEEGCLSELGTIVIDELHMVGDQSRGYLLELMLTKLRYAAGEGNVDSPGGESSGTSSGRSDPARGLQIIGMSATLPNVAAVADWLQAALYETNFRPVPLEEYIKLGSTIYNKEMEIVRTIPKAADLGGKDPDHIVELCNEVVQEGHSVLIFCSSRKGCESTAKHIAKYLKRFSVSPRNEKGDSFDVVFAIDSLRRSPAGLDPILEETLPSGVAYHHAGLTVEERETVETCYRKGLVRVLTATSTLAAGVNLPARRVIFRQPRIGREFIDGTRYKQMAGRAGRTGIDTKGESVMICRPEEAKKILALLTDSCPPLHSCLSEDRNGMTHAILEVVAGGIVQTATDIHRYVRCTLLNSTKPFEDVVRSAQDSLKWLCHNKFLEWSETTKLYTSTPLGRASFGSSLCPEESLSVGNRVGVQEPFLMRMAHGAPLRGLRRSRDNVKAFQGKQDHRHGTSTHGMLSDEQMLRVCKRFYVALILSRLVQEIPVGEVCEGFKVARGMVQALQENAGRFASMVSVFCERIGWHDLEVLVAKFQNRVSFGVRAEIVELTTIPYIKASRARALYKAGLRTPQAIAEASVPEIVKALFESSSWNAHEAQRKIQMGVAKKIKNGARKIVLEKAEEARVAAFSAFKSLGLDTTQFSRPLLPVATGNGLKKESASSSGEESISSYGLLPQSKHMVDAPISGDRAENISVISNIEEDKPVKTLAPNFVSSIKVKSAETAKSETPRETLVSVEECPNTLNHEPILTNNDISHANGSTSIPFAGVANIRSQPDNENRRGDTLDKGPVNAASIPGGVDSFLDLWEATTEFFFDIHFTKKSDLNSIAPFEIHGMAICWENSPVYYLNIQKDLFRYSSHGNDQSTGSKDVLLENHRLEMVNKRWTRIGMIVGKKDSKKFTWNLKVQIQVLKNPAVAVNKFSSLHGEIKSLGMDLIENSYFMLSAVHVRAAIDMCIVAWILSPDEERSSYPNLEKEVKRRLTSDAAASAHRSGRWKDQTRRAAHNGCCRRVSQTRALFSVLWKLLESEKLVEPLTTIEILLVNVLADMEIWGIGVDMEGCLRARHILGRKLKCLQKEAYTLAGKKFSLSMPADIANILFEHLKLPMPEGTSGKQHPSTDKHCLDMLRNEHPIVPVIKEHRSLAKLMNSTLGSICSLARLSMRTQKYTLHGHWLQTSTATGRLSMEEPNLQCVEHLVEFKTNEDDEELGNGHYKINARDFFIPTQDDWLLLTADYSQIELRLMAHFSKDNSLIKLLTSPQGDVFTMIAAKWSEKHESDVSSQERDQTKRLVYGILYGMGPNTLAEQLDCSPDEASERIQNFKKSFPGVASWLQEAVTSCHKKGYVETLKGRKRFLAKIKFGNSKEKSKAQRQAVNSICQGSAADIIKIAMICLHNMIGEDSEASCPTFIDMEKIQNLKCRCRILLQVHDELVLESDPLVVKEAGLLLQTCMERCVSLLVPLPVKLKVGKTWGSLEPFDPNS
ncbi:DNA polymerase I family protein [Striga asiatica]|uniref:DNA polymerase I family protein n=1 Tax=Striga asiatica TaxID=4170 RepID=A0A5A7PZK9_STRAF|nr:DNA polymerase I family protein [Striga asiatica]